MEIVVPDVAATADWKKKLFSAVLKKKTKNFVDSLCFSVPLSLNRRGRRGRREHRDRPGLVPGHQVAKLPVKWERKSVRFRPFLSQHSTCRCKWPADQSSSSILQARL